jgi:dihydroorotate dehydrogenase electron transfer subunit
MEQKALPGNVFQLLLDAPDLTGLSKAGQFVHVRCGDDYDPLLRRPISINRLDKPAGHLTLVYKVVGRGTAQLSRGRAGDYVDIMGPLGNGFTLQGEKPLLIGGGLGTAPLLALADALVPRAVTMVMGAQNAAGLVLQRDFQQEYCALHVATDDGSAGFHGHAPVLAEELLARQAYDIIYACGPVPMLRYIQQMAARLNIPCQLSLEEFMACGVGACLGCTCKPAAEGNPYKKVCTDGPVFWSGEVMLDDH